MEDDKIQIAIYKIDIESDLFHQDESHLSVLENQAQIKGYVSQKLGIKFDNYQVKVYYKKNPLKPKWKNFFGKFIVENQDILKSNQSFSESFVMFISSEETGSLYAVTGGSGFHIIQDFVDDNFGVDILSRLIKKEDKILKSVKEKSVIGGILGTTKFFRKDYNLSENDSFGKIYQELKAGLNNEVLKEHFGLDLGSTKKESTCIAKTSFKINKSIDFDQIFIIIKGCEYVLENPDNNQDLEPIAINNVEKISKKKHPLLVSCLEAELVNQLWKRYHDRSVNIDFDLCHKDFEKYLTASKYIICKGGSSRSALGNYEFKDDDRLDTIDKLFDLLQSSKNSPVNLEDFKELINNIYIYSYEDEDNENYLTKGSLMAHIFGDVYFEEKTYFLIDNIWYQIKDSFINDLNINCTTFIKNNYNSGRMDKKWNIDEFSDENDYNKQYIGQDNTLVLDKILPENIEPCDVLMWDERNLYLYHVKAGFGNTMRDLCSQIFVAANRLREDKLTNKEYINKIYNHLVAKKGSNDPYFNLVGEQTNRIPRSEFVKLFTDKKLVFVLSVRDTSTANERSMKTEMLKFKSNIAKFSLQELMRGMKGIDVDFEFTQILKS